jgi:thiol:disulfide interchange protein DsbD
MMLGVGAWMLSRLVSDSQALLLFVVPAVAGAIVLWRFAIRGNGRWVTRGLALACVAYVALLVTGYARGAIDPLHPLATSATAAGPEFRTIHTVAELDAAVSAAATAGQPVVLDFYADWCVSCKEMERYTFTDAAVRRQLARAVLLRADVTANNADDQALLKRFGIFGPPTIAFYDARGNERSAYRVVGYMKPAAFSDVVDKAFAAP